jgi:hypothetical protein
MPAVYKTLGEGIAGTSMASFDYLTKRDRMALVHYVQLLGGYVSRGGSPEAMQRLSEELASPGERTSNKIPVSMAMEKLETEYAAPSPLALASEERGPEAEILKRTIADASRVSQVLDASGLWRESPQALARSVVSGIPGNGFSSSAATLKPSEWRALYNELMKRIATE